MAKATFHKNQRVFVKPVGTWATIERILPQWVKGLDEPLKVHYCCGLGREFTAAELIAERAHGLADDEPLSETWRIYRGKNRWGEQSDPSGHPHPGTFPIVATDDRNWGGWRVPGAEYDRDPHRIEFQARMIESSPQLMTIAKELAMFAHAHDGDLPDDLVQLARRATASLRRIYDTPVPDAAHQAAE
jgi:hypothetical protein